MRKMRKILDVAVITMKMLVSNKVFFTVIIIIIIIVIRIIIIIISAVLPQLIIAVI